jgi:hypothetical protein
MKINKGLLMGAMLAGVVSTQATVYYWGGSASTDYLDAANWTDLGAGSAVPGPGDLALLHSGVRAGNPWPIVSTNIPAADIIGIGWDSPDGALNVVSGGVVNPGIALRLGHNSGSAGALNMTGGQLVSSIIQIGFADVGPNFGGIGVATLSGDSILHAGTVSFGQAADPRSWGMVAIADTAQFLVNGDHVTDGTASNYVANGWVMALNPGDTISYMYDTNDLRTIFAVNVNPTPPAREYVFFDDFNAVIPRMQTRALSTARPTA